MSANAKSTSLVKEIIKLAGVLLIISAVTAAALGYVNKITKEPIAEIAVRKTSEAMQNIVGEGYSFTPVTEEEFPGDITGAFEIRQNGEYAGLFVSVSPAGFGGKISTVVGIDAEGKVIGVEITKLSETPGLGSKATGSDFLGQYTGLSGPLKVVKNAKTADNDIVAISSATITSKAVTGGVQQALDFAGSYKGGGSNE